MFDRIDASDYHVSYMKENDFTILYELTIKELGYTTLAI